MAIETPAVPKAVEPDTGDDLLEPSPFQADSEAPKAPADVPAPDNGDTPDKAAQRNLAASEKADSWLIKNIVPVMAIIVTLLSFAFFFYVLKYMDFTKDPAKKDIAVYLMGTVSALEVGIVGYYFGSSKGSHDKGVMIDKQLKKLG